MLLFGVLSDIAGWREREVEAEAISALRARLCDDDPRLGEALGRPGVQVALDRELTRNDAALTSRTEVAFMPPMSGG